MNKLILLLSTFVIGVLFLIPIETIERNWFLFSDVKLTLQTHIYFICEKLVLVVLAWIIAAEEKQYRKACQVFFWLVVADLFDYVLSYNSIWFRLGGFPISMNVLKAVIFTGVIVKEWIRTQSEP